MVSVTRNVVNCAYAMAPPGATPKSAAGSRTRSTQTTASTSSGNSSNRNCRQHTPRHPRGGSSPWLTRHLPIQHLPHTPPHLAPSTPARTRRPRRRPILPRRLPHPWCPRTHSCSQSGSRAWRAAAPPPPHPGTHCTGKALVEVTRGRDRAQPALGSHRARLPNQHFIVALRYRALPSWPQASRTLIIGVTQLRTRKHTCRCTAFCSVCVHGCCPAGRRLRVVALHSAGNSEDMWTAEGTGARRAPSPLLVRGQGAEGHGWHMGLQWASAQS